jgi:hypothetical protein
LTSKLKVNKGIGLRELGSHLKIEKYGSKAIEIF